MPLFSEVLRKTVCQVFYLCVGTHLTFTSVLWINCDFNLSVRKLRFRDGEGPIFGDTADEW